MARPGITCLELPPLQYRPDKLIPDFESKRAMIAEDEFRAKLLRATTHVGQFGSKARDLAARLLAGTPNDHAETPASALYMRDQRIRIVGNLHKLIDERRDVSASTFSIIKLGWATFAGDLFNLDACKLKQAFRQDLIRCRASKANGWLFSALDCEFHPPTNNYQFHMHGAATEGMIDVIDALRDRPGYQPWKDIVGVPDCKYPIVRSQQPLFNLPRPLAYAVKHFWKVKVGKYARRLPGDEHTRALLFVDRYRLEDLTLLMNLSVAGGEFRVN